MSNKAKALGAGRFGSSAAAPVSARRQAVAAATGVPTAGVAPPTQLPVDRISPNPDNPRSSLGDLAELAGSLKEHGQKQAITVMNRDAYIKANPGKAADLEPDATHVVVDGSSRLAAARECGLTHLKVWVDDEQGADSEEILESALVANIHRKALPELDEARALQRLLHIHGSQAALAKRLHKSQGWISQRLALLNLTPELQAKIGQEPIKFLRAVGNRPAGEQAAALEELKRKAAGERTDTATTTATAPAPVGVGSDSTASTAPEGQGTPVGNAAEGFVDQDRLGPGSRQPIMVAGRDTPPRGPVPRGAAGEDGVELHYPVIAPEASGSVDSAAPEDAVVVPEQAEGIPEPRSGPSGAEGHDQERAGEPEQEQEQPRRLPYDDPFYVAGHLRRRMEPYHRARLIRFLLDDLKEDDRHQYTEVLETAAADPTA
ncbi:ParB/RepB/Spo0J family partition protein [Streptomyces sp. NPDC047130]|uniref:ParB/RepB/Spo0J family partition protein n=1 Tax=Streptomyces sp. NPDC047130 TaxID=3155261 RepID=UPI0033C3523E